MKYNIMKNENGELKIRNNISGKIVDKNNPDYEKILKLARKNLKASLYRGYKLA